MTRTNPSSSCSYSVFSGGHLRQMILIAEPTENHLCREDDLTQGHGCAEPDWPKQIREVLEKCRNILAQEKFDTDVVMTSFFMADLGKKELVRQLVKEMIPSDLGAITFIPQAPASGKALAVEIWAMAEEGRCATWRETPLPGKAVILQTDGIRWFFAGEMRPNPLPIGAHDRAYDALCRLGDQLHQNRFGIDGLIRTWIYQGHLVLPEGNTQRYKELNRARSEFFERVEFLKLHVPSGFGGVVYPASTGIGADDTDLVISAVAVSVDRPDFIAVPLENPNQTSAFEYAKSYSPQSPKFVRAMAIATKSMCMIFISGTAGITDSESQHPGDVTAQTELTLDNIAALVDQQNLKRHELHGIRSNTLNGDLSTLKTVRVYVKRPEDLQAVQAVCQKRLGNTPTLYTIADVCRPELLVEIEALFFAERT